MAFWTKKPDKSKEMEELSNNLINLAQKVALLKADLTGLEMEVNKIKNQKLGRTKEKDVFLGANAENLNSLNPFKL